MKTIRLLIKDKRKYIESVLKQHDRKTSVLFALACAKTANSISKEDIECIKAVEAWLENPSEENIERCRVATANAASYASASAAASAAAYAYYADSHASHASAYAAYTATYTASAKIGWEKVFDILDEVLETN